MNEHTREFKGLGIQSVTHNREALLNMVLEHVKFPKNHKLDATWNEDGSLTIVDLCEQHKDVPGGCFQECPKKTECSHG